MRFPVFTLRSLAAATLLAASAAPSLAVTLIPNTFVALPGTTSAAEPQLAGTVIEDLVQDFSFAAYGGTVSGSVQSRVVRSDLDGTLDFYWRVSNDARSAGAIQDLRLGSFIAPEYNANWRIDSLGDKGPSVARLFGGSLDGKGFFNFRFYANDPTDQGAGLLPGESSKFILMDTTATLYGRTASYDLTRFGQTQISDQYITFAPIPEPGTWALMALGLVAVATRARQRR